MAARVNGWFAQDRPAQDGMHTTRYYAVLHAQIIQKVFKHKMNNVCSGTCAHVGVCVGGGGGGGARARVCVCV